MMKLAILVLLAGLSGTIFVANAADEASSQQILIKIRMIRGNPCGRGEELPPKVMAEPNLVTLQHFSASFSAGGKRIQVLGVKEQAHMSRRIDFTPGEIRDGKIDLQLTMSQGIVVVRPRFMQTTSFEPLAGELDVEKSRTFHRLPLGKVVKLRWRSEPGEPREWIELSVHSQPE